MDLGYRRSPAAWPGSWRWLGLSHRDALELFPRRVYEHLRVDHKVFGRRLSVVSDPQAIAHICGTASKNYRLSNLHLRMLRPALGQGLIVAEGSLWSLQRRLATQLMPREHAQQRLETLVQRVDRTLDGWLGDAPSAELASQKMLDDLMALSIDLIAQAVFRHDVAVSSDTIVQRINAHRANVERPDVWDALGLSPAWVSQRMRRARRIAQGEDETIGRHIAAAGSSGRVIGKAGSDAAMRRDFVVSLITGFESVTATVTWLVALLGMDTALQERLRAEAAHADLATLGPWQPIAATPTDAVIREVLRLFPPLPLIFRVAAQADESPVGPIASGTLVCISPWIVHRHHELWTSPDVFDPGRHAEESPAYMPFGIGARRCIGMHVGMNLVKTILVQLLQRLRIELPEGRLPQPRAGVSLRPAEPFRVRLTAC